MSTAGARAARCSICVTSPPLASVMFLSRFDGPETLLVRALMCGAYRALSVFRRQQRANPDTSLCGFVQTLCEDSVTTDSDAGRVAAKPLVCLFPELFKQNLLSFIYLVHPLLPQTSVLHLVRCLSQDLHPNPWVTALGRQLERSLGVCNEEPLYSAACGRRLQELTQRVCGSAESGGWKCLDGQTAESAARGASGLSELSTQRKRKGSFDSDGEEVGQQSKRIKTDVLGDGELVEAQESSAVEKSQLFHKIVCRSPAEVLQPVTDSTCDALPEHIKVSILHIRELLESQTEWDQSCTDIFKVLNDWDPAQVDLLCSTLRFSDLPEHVLPKLCSSVLALSPDLSFTTAATLIRSLLLEKVLSLSESASRCLVTTAASLCSRYPRPMCHALIGPMIEEANMGNAQVELLSRLIDVCLDSHYRLLVFQMTLRVEWNEPVLSVIHSLLDSMLDLNEELFTQFIEKLSSQGPQFTKSMKFAKMMLTVLTKYSSHVNAAHKHALSGCLVLSETFLKKSLESALKRITRV